MISVRTAKGYDLPLQGAPLETSERLVSPATVAVLPEHVPFIKPRLAVKEGDRVAVGDLLFTDKANPRIRFLSPGGGHVEALHYGPRRVLREVVIRRAAQDEPVKKLGPPLRLEEIDQCPRPDLVERLLAGGVWPLLRAFPYRDIADPESVPPAIFVSLDAREPFQVPPERYLANHREMFALGLRALKRLCPVVHVHADARRRTFCETFKDVITHAVRGRYPADDAGVLLFHVRQSPKENGAWFINGQDVLLLAQMLQTGQYPTARLFAVAGTGAATPRYVASRMGAPLKDLVGELRCQTPRYTVGGVLRGYAGDPEGHMGLYETSVTVLPEPVAADFLTLFRPGFDKAQLFAHLFISDAACAPADDDQRERGAPGLYRLRLLCRCVPGGYLAPDDLQEHSGGRGGGVSGARPSGLRRVRPLFLRLSFEN